MTAVLRTHDSTALVAENTSAVDVPDISQSNGNLSPRLTELLDWLNRDWDEKSEQVACASFAISG